MFAPAMRLPRTPIAATITILLLLAMAGPVSAQSFEITPFGGYRFGGDFFELITRQRLDIDGASTFGVAVDIPTSDGFQVEGLYTHQSARLFVPAVPFGPPVWWDVSVDHWQAGGLQELDEGRVRPFLLGSLGLTRYAAERDSEIRFSLAGGGGVKIFPSEHLGLRLSSQLFATFADAEASAFACGPGLCFVGFHADVVWQLEFSAGLIVRFR